MPGEGGKVGNRDRESRSSWTELKAGHEVEVCNRVECLSSSTVGETVDSESEIVKVKVKVIGQEMRTRRKRATRIVSERRGGGGGGGDDDCDGG